MLGTRPRSALRSSVAEGQQGATLKCTPGEPQATERPQGLVFAGMRHLLRGGPRVFQGEGEGKTCETGRKRGQQAGLGNAYNLGCVLGGKAQNWRETGGT